MQAFQNIEYSITHWFQPIYNLKDCRILGYEALLRDLSPPQTSPVDLFHRAERFGHRDILDLLSIKTALQAFPNNKEPLFLNIFPSTLLKSGFLSWWDNQVPSVAAVVLELLENEAVTDWGKLKSVTKQLRDRDVRIALDDMGRDYSFLQRWIELEPNFIKLDRYFSDNLSGNPRKQKTVSSLIALLSGSAEIIIEGLETKEDLDTAKFLGISFGQGFLLGRPSPFVNRPVGTMVPNK